MAQQKTLEECSPFSDVYSGTWVTDKRCIYKAQLHNTVVMYGLGDLGLVLLFMQSPILCILIMHSGPLYCIQIRIR